MLNYAKTTKRDGRALSENLFVRQKIARLYTELEIGYAFAYKIAWFQEKGEWSKATTAASVAKILGSGVLQKMANHATEIMGLYGQLTKQSKWAPLEGSMMENYLFSAGLNIAGGTSEIQRNVIAWEGLRLPRTK
ncbi:acyl-CoA dehydrogenase family protein [Thermodesulfobacteriota bacterium]